MGFLRHASGQSQRQTDKQTDAQTRWSQYFALLPNKHYIKGTQSQNSDVL